MKYQAVIQTESEVLRAGKGAVYSYDAIGSHERSGYAVQGSGKDLIQPVLDNQLKAASPLVLPPEVRAPHLLAHLFCTSLNVLCECLDVMLCADSNNHLINQPQEWVESAPGVGGKLISMALVCLMLQYQCAACLSQ